MAEYKTELITVVVPIFNVKDYLEDCVNSIINQTYSNLEIILVDDGSNDGSEVIAENYKNIDNRVTVYHKKNGGLSDARNFGIDKANGKYITFIDSDDWVSREFIEKLYLNLTYYSADVSGCVYRRTTTRVCDEDIREKGEIMIWNSEMALKKMLTQENEFTTSACALLYKIECFETIRYPKGAFFEDLGTTYKILHAIKKIVRTSECLYHYYTREGSISNKRFRPEYMDQYKFAKDIRVFIAKNYPALNIFAISRMVGVCFNLYMMFDAKMLKQYRIYIQELVDTIHKYRWKLVLDINTPNKVRFGCMMSYLGMPICRIIYKKLGIKGK